MLGTPTHSALIGVATLVMCATLYAAPGPGALALVCSQGGSADCNGAQEQFQALSRFTSVDTFDATGSTPTLSQISGYGYVLAWTDFAPNSSSALGTLLANYYAPGGKHLVLATYDFSNNGGNIFLITGPFESPPSTPYQALVAGTTGDVSGNLLAVVPADPIFNGITLSIVQYFHNANFAHPTLAPGATLLATDGAGVDMIARSSNGVVDVNLYPGFQAPNNTALYELLANALVASGSSFATTPVPPAWLLTLLGVGTLALFHVRRRVAELFRGA